ncbi:MAG: hypothetical protein ACUVQY_02640, partial [Thermoproteota archaeon]
LFMFFYKNKNKQRVKCTRSRNQSILLIMLEPHLDQRSSGGGNAGKSAMGEAINPESLRFLSPLPICFSSEPV